MHEIFRMKYWLMGIMLILGMSAAACSSPAAAPASGVDSPTGRSIKVYESPT